MAEQRGPDADASAIPAKGREEPRQSESFDAFVNELRWSGAEEPRKAAEAVLCALSRRLSGGEAEHLETVLPPDVLELIRTCDIHQGTSRAQRLDREEFMTDIADHLGIQRDRVEPLVLAVFTAIRDRIPDEEVARVASELPSDLADLFRRPV